jgi:hypothetical protein
VTLDVPPFRLFQVTVNAVVLYWVTGHRPDDPPNNSLTTIIFTIPYSTNNGVISSSRVAPPDLAMPPPVQDKTKPYRHAPAVSSRDVITSHDERTMQRTGETPAHASHEWSSVRDPSMDYPIARASTIESVRCECRAEGVAYDPDWPMGIIMARWPWRLLRRERREEKGRLESGLESGMPFEVRMSRSLCYLASRC